MRFILTVLPVAAWVAFGCATQPPTEEVLHRYDIHGVQDVVTVSGVAFDPDVTSDANGSLRITAAGTTTFRLYELADVDAEDTRLVYRARIRTEDVDGKAYLEMWCSFPGQGEFFSRALHAPVSGTNEWSTQETPFFLKAGQNPDRVKLNLVIEGSGTVWIDDIVLARSG